MSHIVSPDCRDKNHQKCPGDAWDEAHDHATACECGCHAVGGSHEAMSPAQEAWFDYRKDYGSWHQPEIKQVHQHFIAGFETASPHGGHIGTYPVGLLADLKRRRLIHGLRGYLWRQIKRKNWRAVRQYFNGYLAEWHYPPAGVTIHLCGKGWTRRGAIRRLGIHIAKVNAPELDNTKTERAS